MGIEEQRDAKPENRKHWKNRREVPAPPRIRTDEERARDDAALLASGEPLVTLHDLAAELSVGIVALKAVVWPVRTVRYLSSSSPALYAARDVREAVAPHLERLRARHAAHLAAEAAGASRRAEKAGKHAKVMASKAKAKRGATATATPSMHNTALATASPSKRHTSAFPPRSLGNPPPSRPAPSRRAEPEVFIMRRRPVTTP